MSKRAPWISAVAILAATCAMCLSPRLAKAAKPHSSFRQAPASSAPAAQNSSSAHKPKIWTNEELIATRTPADNYVFQKEALVIAAQEASFNNIMSCFAPEQAEGTAVETQKEIDATLQAVRDSEDAVVQSRKALRTAPDNLRLRSQMELAQRTTELNHERERLWQLQQHLLELTANPAAQHPAAPNVPADVAPQQ